MKFKFFYFFSLITITLSFFLGVIYQIEHESNNIDLISVKPKHQNKVDVILASLKPVNEKITLEDVNELSTKQLNVKSKKIHLPSNPIELSETITHEKIAVSKTIVEPTLSIKYASKITSRDTDTDTDTMKSKLTKNQNDIPLFEDQLALQEKIKPSNKKTIKPVSITNYLILMKEASFNAGYASKIANTIQSTQPVKPLIVVDTPYQDNTLSAQNIDYWTTVHSIESKQGKLLFRPTNKERNCTNTLGPCGHHQLTVQALKDIGCGSKQCRIDRLDYDKSLTLSKKLLALNEKRLQKNGITRLEDFQRYLIHQQGANGIKNILAATEGKKSLSKEIKKNMANNSPYSFKQLKRMGSVQAAKSFMKHWKSKWAKEQLLIVKSVQNRTDSLISSGFIPTFSDKDLNFALNMKF